MDAHLAINLGGDGFPVLHYRAERTTAQIFLTEFVRYHPADSIVIDDQVSPDMKPLPYQRLYP
ncbi:hypothetical protein ACWDYH_31420 [Nocardia goodfellowii]